MSSSQREYLGVHVGWDFPKKVSDWDTINYIELIEYRDKLERFFSVPALFVDQFVLTFQDQIDWLNKNLKDRHQIKLSEGRYYTGLGHTSRTYYTYRFLLYVREPSDLILYKLRWHKPT